MAREVFFPEMPVLGPYVNIHLSGTPYGQVDVASFAKDRISAEFLNKNYKALMFAGWNTCSEVQYGILKEYVFNGGTLFISLPQLCMNETRNLNYTAGELVHGEDFSELCGLKVLGRGDCIYWGIIPPGSKKLGSAFPRRFGILGIPIGDVQITYSDIEVLVVDDEQSRPIVTLHRYGKGKCYFGVFEETTLAPGEFRKISALSPIAKPENRD